ncbi:hypothetical protein RM543_08565 [Roseicyclus sp. F158]|uniref:Uncharacterized protein n=1 Tax=Tropicimonas omnivorans TaxID=3075590 RepID=A0ABU3DHV7_9RHOB|nr:hypothetical protein [Roseicyclus sp. F158]MDT0682737.1 hypothetical protein [Roseicyclus sp. F158]
MMTPMDFWRANFTMWTKAAEMQAETMKSVYGVTSGWQSAMLMPGLCAMAAYRPLTGGKHATEVKPAPAGDAAQAPRAPAARKTPATVSSAASAPAPQSIEEIYERSVTKKDAKPASAPGKVEAPKAVPANAGSGKDKPASDSAAPVRASNSAAPARKQAAKPAASRSPRRNTAKRQPAKAGNRTTPRSGGES